LTACDFCDEFADGSENAYARRYGQPGRIVLRSAGFRVFPSLGQIVEGHLLIVPVHHCCALADLPNEQVNDLDFLCRQVRLTLQDAYNNCVFFEHGIRREGSGGCGIDHAHMHAVPVSANGVLDILMRQCGGCDVDNVANINECINPKASYLFFEDASAKRRVFAVERVPSQYMRKLVAESLGKADWDWRKCGQEPELISAIHRLTPLLSVNAIVPGESLVQENT